MVSNAMLCHLPKIPETAADGGSRSNTIAFSRVSCRLPAWMTEIACKHGFLPLLTIGAPGADLTARSHRCGYRLSTNPLTDRHSWLSPLLFANRVMVQVHANKPIVPTELPKLARTPWNSLPLIWIFSVPYVPADDSPSYSPERS
jgi:hypothetical protein